jgi:hypothetical protein
MKPSSGWPFLKAITAGDRLDPELAGDLRVVVDVHLDQAHLALGRPHGLFENGVSCLQGPHQGAQKSTSTGTVREASSTSALKLAVVASLIRSGSAAGAEALPPLPKKRLPRLICSPSRIVGPYVARAPPDFQP